MHVNSAGSLVRAWSAVSVGMALFVCGELRRPSGRIDNPSDCVSPMVSSSYFM